jgi:hypothetical protein
MTVPNGPSIIDAAEAYLRAFEAENRVYAERALELWSRYDELTPEQRAEVLDRIEHVEAEPKPGYPFRFPLGDGNSGPGGPL